MPPKSTKGKKGKGKAPAFMFYPKDWMVDTRHLSLAARGAWIELLGAMHLAEDRGRLSLTLASYARMLGCTQDEARDILVELVSTHVVECALSAKELSCPENVPSLSRVVPLMSRRMSREEDVKRYEAKKKKEQRDREKSRSCPSESLEDVPEMSPPLFPYPFPYPYPTTNTHPVPTREEVGPDDEPQGGGAFEAPPDEPDVKIPIEGDVTFLEFAEQYPGEVDTAKAGAVWRELFKTRTCSLDELYDGLERWKASDSWQRGYAPKLSNWLRDKRFRDNPPTPAGSARASPDFAKLERQARKYFDIDGDAGLDAWFATLGVDDDTKRRLRECCDPTLTT